MTKNHSTLGIIAGSGSLPAQLVQACRDANRPCFLLAFDAENVIEDVPHAVVRLGAVGEALDHLRKAGVQEVVMAGKVKRPSFGALRPDALGTKLMARMGTAFFGGDDALLRALVTFLEEEGFTVVGSDALLGALTATDGVLGSVRPTAREEEDIAQGLRVAHTLGALDIGQAVIVEHGYVLGVEAAEGTDALITRCVPLKREPRGGVLVKAKKPSQDARVDLPSIGPETVDKIHAGGFAGIAIEAGGALILEREKTIARADTLGIFIIGCGHAEKP